MLPSDQKHTLAATRVLLCFEGNPDRTAIDLMARLSAAQAWRFGDEPLRTLRRRVKDWLGVFAKKLVYTDVDEPILERRGIGELDLAGIAAKV